MAGKSVLFISILLFIYTLIDSTNTSKLNVPRVLLPIFNDFSTNFTLEVTEGGCYKWTTSRLDLVQLIHLDNNEQDCSSRVVVSTISKEPTRNTAIVLAEDIYTGQVLRCDVIVDVICTLNIVTTSRELFMEEAPEAFEVRAYDDQGNEFTSLEGIEFTWTLSSPGSTVLRFITFRDSPYETPASVEAFEEMGKQGNIILLEGVKTGSAKVTCRLTHPEYKKVEPIEVSLMVIANLIIEPADVYILRGDVVHYKIIQVKHGRLEEIQLPSSQYYLVSENTDIGLIEKNSGYLTGMNIGKTRVYLYDRNVNENESGLKLPSATAYVTYPARVSMTLLPHRNWAVMVGEQHDLLVEVFASNDHKIHLGEGVRLDTSVDEKHFRVSQRSVNGSWLSGQAIEQGVAEVHTELVSVISTKLGTVGLEPKLSAKGEILIFPKIVLNPAEVVLPWDPVVRPRYDVEIKATGGDGKFLWSTSNHSVGVVTQLGLVRTQWHGQFDTCASMPRNHHNRQCAKFHILPPSRLEIVEYVMEAEVGAPIYLNIALYGSRPGPGGIITQVPFTKCKELPFTVKSTDNNFYHNESAVSESVGVSCTSIGIGSLTTGTSRITIVYKRDDIHLEESATVSAYRPLELVNPTSGESVLALGTCRYLVFMGGPRPRAGRPSEHVVKVESSNKHIVEAVDSTQLYKVPGGSDTYVISVLCREFGESTITLTVYNKPLVPNCKYQESVATATVICAKPQFIYLQPEIQAADTTVCPMDLSSEKVIVQNYKNIDISVIVKDSSGRKFDNITSLDLQWTVEPMNLGKVLNKNSVYERVTQLENIVLPHKSYQTVEPEKQMGVMEVRADVNGYHTHILRQKKINALVSFDVISTAVTLYLVDNTVVSPNKTSIYNHPLNKQTLSVKQGSGYYELTLSSHDVASVKYNEIRQVIEIMPKQTGNLQISVTDLCLVSPPVVIALNVVYVASIRVEMADRVEIGKCVSAVVRFYDEFDSLMPLPKLEYLDVRYTLEDRIVNVKLAQENAEEPWGSGEIHYIITGVHLGDTKLVFAAGRGDKEVVSSPVNLQVFSPLRIFPKNTTLLVGGVLQLSTQGGPQPDTNIEYTADSKNIVDFVGNGIVHALNIGHTQVTARSVTINLATGKKIINSQDTIDVYVIPLIGIKISAPLTRFVQGATVPVWASGLPEKLSPLVLGTVNPQLAFLWESRCSDIVSLHGILHPAGIHDDSRNKISTRVKGLRPGHCTLVLNVTVPGITAGIVKQSHVTYSSSIDIEVIEGLHLSAPEGFTGKSILIAPFSKMQLKTNRDGYTTLKYSVHGEHEGDAHNKSISIGRPILTVSNDGVIQSYGTLARAMVVITLMDEHGLRQTLSVIVQIKPVHYMLLNIAANWMVPPEKGITVLPVGTEFKLLTSFHDNTGETFAAAQCDLFFRTSRFDLLDVKRGTDNTSLYVSSINAGGTVVKVWAENCLKTADYVQIYGEQIAVPNIDTITSGDILCMYSPVVNNQRQHTNWYSEPDSVLTMNAAAGIGYAISNRAAKAYIKYDLTPAAKISLDVQPVSDISFIFDSTRILSNTPGNVFQVPVLFRDAKNFNKKTNLFAGWHCQDSLDESITSFPFTCGISFANDSIYNNIWDVLEVVPGFNKDLGLYSCNLIPSGVISANTSVIESNITLVVLSDNSVESYPLEIKFLPAIYIASRELIVSDTYFTATLAMTGLPHVLKQVTVTPHDKALLKVNKITHDSPTHHSYEINLIDYHWKLDELKDPMSIKVVSKMTNQNIKIQVKLSNDKASGPFCPGRQMGSPLGNFIFENKQSLVIVLSMLVLFFVTFYAYSHYFQPVINVNVAPERNMLLNSSPLLNSSGNKTFGCSTSTCYNRTLNTSISPTMRYGTGEVIRDRPLGSSPELRRNRRFL